MMMLSRSRMHSGGRSRCCFRWIVTRPFRISGWIISVDADPSSAGLVMRSSIRRIKRSRDCASCGRCSLCCCGRLSCGLMTTRIYRSPLLAVACTID